jgi:hypothetical protein
MWTPEGIPVDSMDSPWNLFGLLMESNRMRGSVSLTHHFNQVFTGCDIVILTSLLLVYVQNDFTTVMSGD